MLHFVDLLHHMILLSNRHNKIFLLGESHMSVCNTSTISCLSLLLFNTTIPFIVYNPIYSLMSEELHKTSMSLKYWGVNSDYYLKQKDAFANG